MRRKTRLLTLLLCAGVLSAAAQDNAKLEEGNRLLEAELTLAKMPGSYMAIDLRELTVALKARGVVLKKWNIQKARVWGKPVPLKVFKMLKKSALSQPERPNITPGKAETKKQDKERDKKDSFDLGVLELKDMPVHYTLAFGQDIIISVKPKTKRFWPALINVGKTVSWYAYLPLKTLWSALKRKTFTKIELVIANEKDAQGIYWSFLEGHNTLVFQPKK